ncbi:hypothetical protein P8452_25336 [Trifolium repens]|nr:hypothetical protein P8452_25336 [Trifolium repens]
MKQMNIELIFSDRNLKSTNRNGFLDNNTNLCGDWNHRVSLHQNLLQQRTFCKSISPNSGYYCNNMLLDDVGDCIFSTNETAHSTYTKWRISLCEQM